MTIESACLAGRNNIAPSSDDDKRVIMADGIHSSSWTYKLKKIVIKK